MTYYIEKNIPRKSSGHNQSKYPFAKMELGDSFFYEGERSVITSAAAHGTKKTGWKFSISKENNGFRVWRVE